jgi:hypothetical protein
MTVREKREETVTIQTEDSYETEKIGMTKKRKNKKKTNN